MKMSLFRGYRFLVFILVAANLYKHLRKMWNAFMQSIKKILTMPLLSTA